MAVKYRFIEGIADNSGTVRTFIGGQYLSPLTVKGEHDETGSVDRVFVSSSLLHCINAGLSGKCSFWNRRLYAARTPARIDSDTHAARRLSFHRDQYVLRALALTVFVPVWVAIRRAILAGTADEMRQFLRA